LDAQEGTVMNPIYQEELAALLGAACFLRRSRSDEAFFITDAPRRLAQSQLALLTSELTRYGYVIRLTPRGLWQIDLGEDRLRALVATLLPSGALLIPAQSERLDVYALTQLLYLHPAPWDAQPKEPLRALLKRYDRPAEFADCARKQLENCAELLRLHLPLSSAAANVTHAWLNEI
jgi:hypothetical protein